MAGPLDRVTPTKPAQLGARGGGGPEPGPKPPAPPAPPDLLSRLASSVGQTVGGLFEPPFAGPTEAELQPVVSGPLNEWTPLGMINRAFYQGIPATFDLVGRLAAAPFVAVGAAGDEILRTLDGDRSGPHSEPGAFGRDMNLLSMIAPMLLGDVAPMGLPRVPKAAENVAENPPRLLDLGQNGMASRNARMYNPPVIRPRRFEEDYPYGALSDATGQLTADLEGRPLLGGRIAGRQVLGGADVAISPKEYDAISEGLIGSRPQAVPPRALPEGVLGQLQSVRVPDIGTNLGPLVRTIQYASDLDKASAPKVVAHEIGHSIEYLARFINIDKTRGLRAELEDLYDIGNRNPKPHGSPAPDVLPKDFGYGPWSADRELIAEAIRLYMANPGYVKRVTPKAAAKIREAFNSNPNIAPHIQFNSILGLGTTGVGAGTAAGLVGPGQEDRR